VVQSAWTDGNRHLGRRVGRVGTLENRLGLGVRGLAVKAGRRGGSVSVVCGGMLAFCVSGCEGCVWDIGVV
jgi:hypothetical protein